MWYIIGVIFFVVIVLIVVTLTKPTHTSSMGGGCQGRNYDGDDFASREPVSGVDYPASWHDSDEPGGSLDI
jgi:hypothetical protein